MLMINKRLIREVDSSMKYVGLSVLCQWGMLVLNIVLIAAIAKLLEDVILQRDIFGAQVGAAALLAVVVSCGRAFTASCSSWAAAIVSACPPAKWCR